MTVVGVDVSSRRIDTAWLDEQGRPQRWHIELGKGHLIDRLRRIEMRWPNDGLDLSDVAVEYPFGRGNAIAALMATTGIVTRQAPPWARVAWPSSGELRAAIGATRNTKHDAHDALWLAHKWDSYDEFDSFNEHERDALVACIGWTNILRDQDTAA